MPGERSGGLEHVDQPLERHVLVGVRGQVGLPHPCEQLTEGGIAVGTGAQHEGVDEEADDVLDRFLRASGDGRAERDVVARAEPAEQRGEGRLHDHEEADTVLPRHLAEPGVQLRREVQPDHVPPVARLGGPGSGGGEAQLLRQVGELFTPVGELGKERAVRVVLASQHLALPEGVVGVLDGGRRQERFLAGVPGRVGGAQVPGDDGHGPAVAGDVVHQQEQHVVFLGHPEQPCSYGEFGGEVEGVRAGGGDIGVQGLRGAGHHRQLRLRPFGRQHRLVRAVRSLRLTGPHLHEEGAQALVPRHRVAERGAQRVHVGPPGQAQRGRDVVRRTGALQMVQEPQPLLCRGERQPRGAGAGG
ncbi:hypothetical protein SBADM41S_11741 [Streptomyces badius]